MVILVYPKSSIQPLPLPNVARVTLKEHRERVQSAESIRNRSPTCLARRTAVSPPARFMEIRHVHRGRQEDRKTGRLDAWTLTEIRKFGARRAQRNRHRGESHLSSPATPPDVRVRIRRFGWIELNNGEQLRQSKRCEVSIGKRVLHGGAVCDAPWAVGTSGRLCSQIAPHSPLT
jgi:hypothetical protein